jgi:D-psicose/D-tagatose/L-ribulose 3-epimerase
VFTTSSSIRRRAIRCWSGLDWEQLRQGLERNGYRGMLGFESFTAGNASIATAASIWRAFAPTQDDLALRALET